MNSIKKSSLLYNTYKHHFPNFTTAFIFNFHKSDTYKLFIQSKQYSYSAKITGENNFKVLTCGDKVNVKRIITLEDVKTFSELSGDFNPIHSGGSKGKVIVHGALLSGLVSGVIGTELPGPGTKVLSQSLEYPNSCYADEEVSITVEITSARKIVVCNFVCVACDNNKVVLRGEAKLMVTKL